MTKKNKGRLYWTACNLSQNETHHLKTMKDLNKKINNLKNSNDEILGEIYSFCGSACHNNTKCLEDKCVLYRIEKMILEENNE